MPDRRETAKHFFDERERLVFACPFPSEGKAYFAPSKKTTVFFLWKIACDRIKLKEKKMKKTRFTTWVLSVLLFICCIALVACVDKPVAKQLEELTLPKLKDGQMAVIIKNGDKDYTSYTVTLTENMKTGEDVIEYLAQEAELDVDWTESEYGKYINKIGGLSPDASKNEYVTVLTSVAKDKGNYAGVTTYTVGDVTLVSSQVGISEMTVEQGAVIYFEIASY